MRSSPGQGSPCPRHFIHSPSPYRIDTRYEAMRSYFYRQSMPAFQQSDKKHRFLTYLIAISLQLSPCYRL